MNKNWVLAFAAIATLGTAAPTLAQDESATTATTEQTAPAAPVSMPHVYAPDYCEFKVAFPEEPYKTRRCDSETQTKCVDQISFTQFFDMASTVNFRVMCSPLSEGVVKEYDEEVMKATLRALTKQNVDMEHNIGYREGDNYKQAALVGEGTSGRTPMIYIAQMWLGEHSSFTVEAELIGNAHDEADVLFRDILRSIVPLTEGSAPEDPAIEAEETKEPAE